VALSSENVEWRIVPAERLEDRPEQERPPAHIDAGLSCQPLNAHGSRIGIGAAEFVPELDIGHGYRP
jgi:hypothetical protein